MAFRIHFQKLSARLRGEDGIALVMALGIMAVLGILATSAVSTTTTNSGSARRSKTDQVAFNLAETGLNLAFATLSLPSNNALDPYLLAPTTLAYEGGTVTYSGTLDPSTSAWTIVSTGSSANPVIGSAPVARTLREFVDVQPALSQPLNNMGWNYIWATRTGFGCDMTIGQSVNVASPLYVEGNLCLQNTATITTGPLVVKGSLSLSQKANGVGSAAAPINEAHIARGCQYWNKGLDAPCKGSPDNVYAKLLDAATPPLVPPQPAWDSWYLNANPGPYYPCATASGPVPVFDNDQGAFTTTDASRHNDSVGTPFNLTPPVSYSCKTDAGEISWDSSKHLLTLTGTVFIDGSAYVSNGAVNQYAGQGSLYLSGTMLLKNASLCAIVNGAGTGCDTKKWDPNTTLLVLVANGDGARDGQVPNGDSIQLVSATFQGALFGTNAVETDTTSQNDGPMIGSTVILGQSVNTSFPLIRIVPVGMPSNPTIYAQPSSPHGFSG